LDIVIGNYAQPNMVFMNKGEGKSWNSITLNDENLHTYDIMTADLNGDGRLDIIESNSDELNKYYFNFEKKKQ